MSTKEVPASGKKDLRKKVASELNESLQYLKELLGEKAFNDKVKEAAKLFTKGFKKAETPKPAPDQDKKEKAAPVKKTVSTKIAAEKKQPSKKAAPKKTTVPKEIV